MSNTSDAKLVNDIRQFINFLFVDVNFLCKLFKVLIKISTTLQLTSYSTGERKLNEHFKASLLFFIARGSLKSSSNSVEMILV